MADLKIPPHSIEAEESVLGAILLDKDAIIAVSDFLRADHFYNDNHGIVYESMLELFEKGSPIDIITLSNQLKKKKISKEVSSTSFLTEIVNKVPTSANIEHYGKIIKNNAIKRELIRTSANITEMAFKEDGEVEDLIDKTESSIFAISQSSIRKGFIPLKETINDSFNRLEEIHTAGEGLRGVPTGFPDLDTHLSGFQKSNLIIMAARPGQGKTAFMLNIAQHIAAKEKLPVGFFSLEMSKEELVDRLLVSQADIDAWKLKTGKLSEDDFDRIAEAMGELAEAPLFLDDTPGITLMEMRTKARRLQLEHGVKFIVVDYLQLIDPGRRLDNRVVEVGLISQGLKNLARELQIPVLAASQLSRAVENRTGDKRPQLSDLRESGSIEQDADVVMFLHRPDDSAPPTHIPVKVLIAKHRNGPTGEVDLIFKGDRIRFVSTDFKHNGAALPDFV